MQFYTGITFFALVLHFFAQCYTLTALLSANQNRVIFLSVYIINRVMMIVIIFHAFGMRIRMNVSDHHNVLTLLKQ